jgi:hypothetical protein
MDEDIKKLVKERLLAMPANVSFSIGDYGDFTRDQLIKEVEGESEIGNAVVEMQLEFIKHMPKILKNYGT